MKFQIVSLFPAMIEAALQEGVVAEARRAGKLEVVIVNPRDFAKGGYRRADDRPYGGGDGMVMMVDPLKRALASLPDPGRVAYLSPQGRLWSDEQARSWAASGQVVTLIAGRYAGVDQRFLNAYVTEEVSIGNYVLTGGELAALVVMDTVARFLPGVLGNPLSSAADSFAAGLLEAPLFTRPRQHELGAVPEALLSGDHAEIERLRHALALAVTAKKRPDLIEDWPAVNQARLELHSLTEQDLALFGLRPQDLLVSGEGR